MKKYGCSRFILLLAMFLLWALPVGATPAQEQPLVRVGLWVNQQSVMVSSDSEFQLITEYSKVAGKFAANEKVALAIKNEQITINGKVIQGREVLVLPINSKTEATVEVNRRKYRGALAVHQTVGQTGLTVVNTLPVEQYLYGIIAREMSPDWPIEAIKAQAVAARTYALYSMNKHERDGYDVCATTDCQVYGGMGSEAVRSSKAVDDTKGLVLHFEGKLIPAYFHASSGGFTENCENVWTTALPYIRAVVDYDHQSPHYQWTKEITPAELNILLGKAGYTIGDIQAFTLSRLEAQPVRSTDRGISGRVKSIRLAGSKGSVLVTGNKLRSLLGLNSTLFDLAVVTPPPPAIEVPITDSFGDRGKKKVEVNLKPVEEKGLLMDKEYIRRITGRQQEKIVINGRGWGHGLGLSQWGAKAMAEKSAGSDIAYFKQILKHYYQGVDIAKIY